MASMRRGAWVASAAREASTIDPPERGGPCTITIPSGPSTMSRISASAIGETPSACSSGTSVGRGERRITVVIPETARQCERVVCGVDGAWGHGEQDAEW